MFRNIFNTFANCFKIPELKSRIIFTILVLAVCRLAAYVPVPSVDGSALAAFARAHSSGGGLFGLTGMFSGGAMERCAIGALGIMPYISATIIIQLLTAVVPTLSKLAREENGRAQIIKYSRYLTVILCMGWGIFQAISWENPSKVFSGYDGGPLVTTSHIWLYRMQTVLILTTGTMILLWLGEQITERGVGNGVSLIITVNILARLPQAVLGLKDLFMAKGNVEARLNLGHGVLLVVLMVMVIGGCIAITQAQRKIPVQYAQRAVGRKMYQGGTSFMPLRVNYAGVMPVIFASAILMFPQRIFSLIGTSYDISWLRTWGYALDYGSPSYLVLYGLMILFFSYFWVATQFNELQIADDLKKNGGYIPGVRPGQATSDYLHNTMSRITLAGAVILTVIAVIPIILSKAMGMDPGVSQFFGGTSMLIAVGVMLDTMRQMESHLMMRHYDGFLKKGKLRGRFS